jgi:HEAT repeat protein
MNSIFALGVINDERTVDPVIAAINDPAWQVREKAAWGLGLKKDPRVAEALVPALRDAQWQVRSQAAWALGLQGNRNTVGPLSAALTDENPCALAGCLGARPERGLAISRAFDGRIEG